MQALGQGSRLRFRPNLEACWVRVADCWLRSRALRPETLRVVGKPVGRAHAALTN